MQANTGLKNKMSNLTVDIVADVVAAAQAGAEEAAGALSRALDSEFALSVGEAGKFSSDDAPDAFSEAGLVVLLKFGDVCFAAVLPESSDMLPGWYATPDPTGESKLSTLAQELSMLLVPETLMADKFQAARVDELSAALAAAGVAENAALVPLELSTGERTAQLSLIWPLATPEALLPPEEAPNEATNDAGGITAAPVTASPSGTAGGSHSSASRKSPPLDVSQLPDYSRSLLRISVPVSVMLASKKEDLKDVTELVPGTIIKFDKACDEMLQLYVGTQAVAEGEAIKVGDKFGFRVGAMLMPDEHFRKVRPTAASSP